MNMYRNVKTFCYFFCLYLTNHIFNYIPIYYLRYLWYKCWGMKLSKSSKIDMGQYFLAPSLIELGNHSHINQGCILDARGGIKIGNNVSISHHVTLMTGSHDINSPDFKYTCAPIVVDDYAFIGVNATILQGVTIGKGAVVCAGAIVTKNVPEYAIVASIPAKIIGYRNDSLNYRCTPYGFLL